MPEIKVKYRALINNQGLAEAIRKALPKKKFYFSAENQCTNVEEFVNVGDIYKVKEIGTDGKILASINIRGSSIPVDSLLMEYEGSKEILMKIRQKLPMDKVSLFHE